MFKQTITEMIKGIFQKAAHRLVDLTKVKGNRSNRIYYRKEYTPWVRIPNIQSFQVELGRIDIFFALFGIKRTYRSTMEFTPYKSRGLNRYIEHQIKRLVKARDNNNAKLYFKMSDVLMKRSNTFRMLAINHVFHQ